jgi:hypothetical protein
MLLPAHQLAPGGAVAAAWGGGAYSDDLNLAALAGSLGQRILCPGCAVFPVHLAATCTRAQAWNYLRRQLYVLDTYMSPHNRCARGRPPLRADATLPSSARWLTRRARRVNHGLLACTVYCAGALLAPMAPVLLHLAVRHAAAARAQAPCAG